MAEIVPVVSEALEKAVRDLLPSQRGFGEDLQASNVITPIINLTPTAEGTTTPEILQTALAFGSQTAFSVQNSTVVVANSPGFYRVYGVSAVYAAGSTLFDLSDGLSTKSVWVHTGGSTSPTAIEYDFVVFLASGESISVTSTVADCRSKGSSRQIADVNGNLVNPSGFTPQ